MADVEAPERAPSSLTYGGRSYIWIELPEGRLTVEWPASLSQKSAQEARETLELIARRLAAMERSEP